MLTELIDKGEADVRQQQSLGSCCLIIQKKKYVFNFSTLKWGVEAILFFKAHPSSASDYDCSCLGYFLLNDPDTGSSASRLCLGVEAWNGSSFPCLLSP